jgi:hypothetical protein
MGDAGEGLIDAESRIQERMDELARERAERRAGVVQNPEALRGLESLRLARAALQSQFDESTHDRRRAQLTQALSDLDARIATMSAQLAK